MASDEGEQGARFEKTAIRAKRSLQELLEVAGGHPVVFDLQLVVGVARAIDVVRRTVKTRSAASAPINLATSARLVASPTRSLCSPRSQRSAGAEIGVSGSSSTASSSA